MGARSRELVLLLAVCALALGATTKSTKKVNETDEFLDQYLDYDADQEVLFNEDTPCPRDCICTLSQGYRMARCNRLEIGTQKFGADITDLVVENSDPEFPIQLTENIFITLGLHKVSTIKIVNSPIDYIDRTAFHGLKDLYSLTLTNNQLKGIHPETFIHNSKLLILTLSENPIKLPAAGSEDIFLNASSVQELSLSNCNLQYLGTNTFRRMPTLMYLDLSKNEIVGLHPDIFKNLLDLEELDLSDNKIKSLPSDIFAENTELATLHIDRNPIDTVYGLNMSSLLTLTAAKTNIRLVGPSIFNGVTFMANLNLSGNNIEKIHNQAFHKLNDLNYLDLSYNNLTFISNELIKENIELDVFKISNNPELKHLPVEGFNSSVEVFNIYTFDASNCGLEEIFDNSLKTFTALTSVYLSGNKIKYISNKAFAECPRLVEIDLSYNLITELNGKVFRNNVLLSKLYLQGNPLKVLSAEIFTHTPDLTFLDISNGALTTLWKEQNSLPKTLLNNLTFLNVSRNRISEIKEKEIATFNKLRTFDVRYNPLTCSHEFENFMIWLNKKNVSPNSDTASIANLAKDSKDDSTTYSWEFLSKKVCGNVNFLHPVEPLPEVSDEEIWERIDKTAEGDFDLKNTLGDASNANDDVNDNKLSSGKVWKSDVDKFEDDNDADDEADDDEDEDEDDEDDDIDGEEEYDDDDADDDVDLKIKVIEKSTVKPEVPKLVSKIEKEKIQIGVKLLENDSLYDDMEPEVYMKASVMEEEEHGHYDYLWPLLISILGALLLLIVIAKVVMVVCSKRNQQIRYNSAIIAAMSQSQGRTKKDCGLVYQQLSEDLTGPATPKLNRYQPLHTVTVKAANVQSYESSPFHHSNIVPEAV
ncbi:insulin-like growth factor-binding protein complex acid labile subunit [Plodia interpunctella]|uniref:insulin-like growth factor-binding protein complex acid labile subunit n=1 Tax=Plodia interpunctella TaxID=58824 RepID=UPI002368BDF2|nr:insulin-like growth factor-binding protein complex acid labile subunit [Plodia interpunctella]